MSALREHFVPILDGERLLPSGEGYVHEDGNPVDPARLDDIVYVNADDVGRAAALLPGSTGWWRALDGAALGAAPAFAGGAPAPELDLGDVHLSQDDLKDLLRTLADTHTPLAPVEFDAAFFHRTLVRWMGLEAPGATERDPVPVWDYDFWKAELVEEREQDGVRTFRVDVHRGDGDAPERYRYWIQTDASGALEASGWLTDPPDLLGEEKGKPRRFVPAAPDPAVVQALLASPE